MKKVILLTEDEYKKLVEKSKAKPAAKTVKPKARPPKSTKKPKTGA